jgi:fluoride ion exporter CrcB/FEX
MENTPKKIRYAPGPIELAGFLLAAALVGCLLAAWYLDGNRSLNFLLCIFGGVSGGVVTILIRPHTDEEAKEVSEYGKAIIALVAGFLLARIDQVFKTTLDVTQTDMGLFVSRGLLFGSTFFLGVLFVFVFVVRRYWSKGKGGF